MLVHPVILMMVFTLMKCEVLASSDGLRRDQLTKELSKAEQRLQGLRAIEEMTRDYVWLDNTWILAFRVRGASGQSSYSTFYNRQAGDGPVERMCGTLNYRNNQLLNNWPSSLVDTVRVSIRKDGTERAFVDFNAKGSTFDSWFDRDRVLNSSWTDLKSQSAKYFSITGDVTTRPVTRRFYVCHKHNGCPGDVCWLAIVDGPDVCKGFWNYPDVDKPIIIYSTRSHMANFSSNDVGVADEMVIAVKLRDVISCTDSCHV